MQGKIAQSLAGVGVEISELFCLRGNFVDFFAREAHLHAIVQFESNLKEGLKV